MTGFLFPCPRLPKARSAGGCLQHHPTTEGLLELFKLKIEIADSLDD